ncbi:MAG: CHAT domain-containing protein [Deltaproteobacteria bacterium]
MIDARPTSAYAVLGTGEERVFAFTVEEPIRLRLAPADAATPPVRWRTPDDEHTLHCERAGATAEHQFLHCDVGGAPIGEAHLVVGSFFWPALRVVAPKAHPKIAEALSLEDPQRQDEALRDLAASEDRWLAVGAARTRAGQAYEDDSVDATIAAFDEAATVALRHDLTSLAARSYRAALYVASRAGRFGDARRYLARAEALTPELVEDRARLVGERAGLAMDLGLYRDAEELYRETLELAAAAGLLGDHANYALAFGAMLVRVGRYEDAQRWLNIGLEHADDFGRATYLANLAELEARRMLSGDRTLDYAVVEDLLVRSEDAYRDAGFRREAADRRTERAWWAALDGHYAAAAALLKGEPAETLSSWGLGRLASARISFHRGEVEAAYATLDELVATEPTSQLAVAALAMRTAFELERGARTDAVGSARRALAALDGIGRRTHVRRSASGFLARNDEVRALAVDALVATGAIEEAFEVGDDARARVIRRLQDTARIEPARAADRSALRAALRIVCPFGDEACEAQRDRRLDELVDRAKDAYPRRLAASPPARTHVAEVARVLPDGHVFVALERGVSGRRVFSWSDDAVVTTTTAGVLGALVEGLREARHVYLVSQDADDFEALVEYLPPERDGPTWSLIPYVGWLTKTATITRGPLVVAAEHAPGLGAAHEEVSWLLDRFESAEPVHDLAALGTQLGRARALHFAGHAVPFGRDPWLTFLRLGPDALITLDDVFRLRPRLRLAVLNGCATGRAYGAADIGFPQALLATGTHSVVATVRPVRDASALAFVKHFYGADGLEAPGAGFRAAVRAMRANADPAWRAFRLFGRP